MKKKPRKTKLPRRIERLLRFHVPASLPPEFFNTFRAAIARAIACGEITAEAAEALFREQAEKHHRMMDRFVEEKFVVLLQHYGIPEDAPGAGWHSAAAGWRLASALAHDLFPWIGRTDDAPPKLVGRQPKTAEEQEDEDEKLVMAVEAALAKPGTSRPQAFAKVARLPEYKKHSVRKIGAGWVAPAYYRAKARRKMRRLSLINLYQEDQ